MHYSCCQNFQADYFNSDGINWLGERGGGREKYRRERMEEGEKVIERRLRGGERAGKGERKGRQGREGKREI